MHNEYKGVKARFLRHDERLMVSDESEMPLVIEPNGETNITFLQAFLSTHSDKIVEDVAKYGAILFRGFDVASDEDFEKSILSVKGLRGISEAFMSEHGRIHVNNLQYVLYTNAVYKTGGTLYLGGFHSENYYNPDVPSYIGFCCHKPSLVGGETGLINMEKVYEYLTPELKERLEKNSFFVSKWLISEVAERYQISTENIERICDHFNLPIVGKDNNKFVTMYKPSVFTHPLTKKKALQINFFELPDLNTEMRKCFINDYQGKTWFWHRFVWRLPHFVFKSLEFIFVICASTLYSPKESFNIFKTRLSTLFASIKNYRQPKFNKEKVGNCFKNNDIKELAKLMRKYYSSCLWKKGDIMLVDNRKVVHAGMPGSGPRLVRAMICNPIDMKYSPQQSGHLDCKYRTTETVGYYMTSGEESTKNLVTQSN